MTNELVNRLQSTRIASALSSLHNAIGRLLPVGMADQPLLHDRLRTAVSLTRLILEDINMRNMRSLDATVEYYRCSVRDALWFTDLLRSGKSEAEARTITGLVDPRDERE